MNAPVARRAVLGFLAAAPIAASACAAGAPAFAAPGESGTIGSTFDAQLARYRQIEAVHDAACAALSEAEGAFYASHPVRPESVWQTGDTAESYNRRIASDSARYQAAVAAARALHRVEWHEAREIETCNALARASDALMEMPAPGIAAVAIKLDLARERGLCIDQLAPVLADVRRLAGSAAA